MRLCFNFTSTSHFRRGAISSERQKTTANILRRLARPSVPVLYAYHLQCFSRDRHLHKFPPLEPLRPPDALNFHLRRNEWIDVNCFCQANLLSHQVPLFPPIQWWIIHYWQGSSDHRPERSDIHKVRRKSPAIDYLKQTVAGLCVFRPLFSCFGQWTAVSSFKMYGPMPKRRLHFLRSQWVRKLEAAYFGVFCVGRKGDEKEETCFISCKIQSVMIRGEKPKHS